MSDANPHTGRCRCGAVRFQAAAEPDQVSYCHCADCRRATGAPVSAFVGFPTASVTIAGEGLKSYENGPVARTFCAICGSPIAYVDARIGDHVYFLIGAMDAPRNYKPTHHAHVRSQLPFLHMPDGLPRMVGTSVPRPAGETS